MIKDLPLAAYFRPKNLKEFYGQERVVGPEAWLFASIKNDKVPSLIFWGPPGSGKTTLAAIIAKETKAEFKELSATGSGVKDLKIIVEQAREAKRLGMKTILFIDEIHRWNKAQQDALLPQVETGTITLIGATTENPSFAVNAALLSRAKVVVLEALREDDLLKILERALKELKIKVKRDVLKFIARVSSGDARRALNILESALEVAGRDAILSLDLIKAIIYKPGLLYDKSGDEHYNLISALHKSMRGGDADAAMYYSLRMVMAGEDPLYLARRMIRFASEDIGLANNSALMLATATYDACKSIGLPECGVNLAHCAAYLAKSPKSVAVYFAHNEIMQEIENSGSLPVPMHLRNAPTKLMKDLEYGKDYKYTPTEDSSKQTYLPEKLNGRKFLKKI
ncbi:replication-associated recombination protein A [Candidatus Falkowbacteria bacterium]|nr:replication-associated recombination protein A [Candidatus Falkowbacteria bacterium]